MINSRKIIQLLQEQKTDIQEYKALDGITIECKLPEQHKFDLNSFKQYIKEVLYKLNLPSALVEQNKEMQNVFIIQFPDMIPEYTDEEVEQVIKDNLSMLVQLITSNSMGHVPDKDTLRNHKGMLVRDAVTMYFKGYANQYKQTEEDYIGNLQEFEKYNKIFDKWLLDVKLK